MKHAMVSTVCVIALVAAVDGGVAAAGQKPEAGKRVTVMRTTVDVDHDGKADIVQLEMTRGRRYTDSDWCGAADKYEGEFVIAVVLANGARVETRLNPLLGEEGEEIWFRARPAWRAVIRDYNGDGQPEFNLGQYASCNGYTYRVFAIRASGRVDAVSDRFFVSDSANSTTKLLASGSGFRFRYYDNTSGTWEAVYQWDAGAGMFRFKSKRRME